MSLASKNARMVRGNAEGATPRRLLTRRTFNALAATLAAGRRLGTVLRGLVLLPTPTTVVRRVEARALEVDGNGIEDSLDRLRAADLTDLRRRVAHPLKQLKDMAFRAPVLVDRHSIKASTGGWTFNAGESALLPCNRALPRTPRVRSASVSETAWGGAGEPLRRLRKRRGGRREQTSAVARLSARRPWPNCTVAARDS